MTSVPDDKVFGVYTHKKSFVIDFADDRGVIAVLETRDGLTHHIRIIEITAKYLRYVLRHEQKVYLVVVQGVRVHPPTTGVNCITCLALGPETGGRPL